MITPRMGFKSFSLSVTGLVMLISSCKLCSAKSVHFPLSQETFIKELLDWRDIGADPCEDFYRYSCGSKLDENDPQHPFQGLLTAQQIETYTNVKDLLESHGTSKKSFGKAVQFFDACIEQNIQENFNVLVDLVDKIGGWPLAVGPSWQVPGDTLTSILPAMGKVAKIRLNSGIIDATVGSDPFSTSNLLVQLSQPPGLMVNYAPSQSQKLAIARSIAAYARYLSKSSYIPDLNAALQIVTLNNMLWQILEPFKPKMKDNYIVMTMGEFTKETNIDIVVYLNSLFEDIATFKSDDNVVVSSLEYFQKLAKVLSQHTTRTVMDFELMATVIPGIGESGILSGMRGRADLWQIPPAPTRLPRPPGSEPKHIIHPDWLNAQATRAGLNWFTCLQKTVTTFSFTTAKQYYEKYFTKTERKQAKEATEEIIKVFESRMEEIEWLDASALQEAKNKIENMRQTYVYENWVDNDELLEKFYATFDASNNYLGNYWESNIFIRLTNLRLLSKSKLPLNVTVMFDIGPLDVNAYYYPPDNSFNILEAIMQPPTFDSGRIELFNFAMLGAIIGHEITHGFDNSGQQYDEHGNLRDWMSPEVHKRFMDKAQCYVNQYNQYTLTSEDFPVPGFIFQINGTKTLGENIADNGGFQQAYWAYKAWVKKNGEEKFPSSLSKYTPEQVFFLSYGHLWCNKYQGTQQEINILNIDVHTPAKFRVIGTLSNFNEFSKAFNCGTGSKMNRGEASCDLW